MTDPRLTNGNVNVNEAIQDRTIRHMVYLERFKASEIRRIRKILDGEILPDLQARIEKRLESIKPGGKETTARLLELEKELLKLTKSMGQRLGEAVFTDLAVAAKDEIDWQVKSINDEVGVDLDFVVPAPRAVANVIKNTPFAGLNLDQWFGTLSNATQRGVMTAVNRGIVEGQTTAQIMQAIRGSKKLKYTDGVWATTRRQVETITRSTVNHVSNAARAELFKENEDIIQGLQWTATLDSRTSITCASLDGKVFPLNKGPRPPAHPNCRSTMTAVLKDWQALGLDESQRASVNGQVAGQTTFGQWLKRQPLSVQQEVLGVTRARLFNQGQLDIARFTDSNLKPLTLDQLRDVEQKAFKKAKIDL